LTDLLGFKKGSSASSYTQLYVAFFISGLIHSGGDMMVDLKFTGASFPFFLAQAVCITLEDGIIALFKKSGVSVPSSLARWVGYLWVTLWFTYSCPMFFNWITIAGIAQTKILPYSPTRVILLNIERSFNFDIRSQVFPALP
jgi:hypothetical protein